MRHDNKVRLSPDVLEKAGVIASEWGLKNARAAVEAVFRRYADDYRRGSRQEPRSPATWNPPAPAMATDPPYAMRCEALAELDELLGL